jgi:exonuclease III
MKHNILTWNVRGLNSLDKRLMVRILLRQWRVDIVCLQETKLELISRRMIRSFWGYSYVDCCYVASIEASGDIILMWDKRVINRLVMYKFNCTRQLHESIVIEWMCKCECRTHRKSCLSKTNLNA